MTTLTVYENNRKDSPRQVTARQVVEKVKKSRDEQVLHAMPKRVINLATAEFGSFDPRSESYELFEARAVNLLKQDLNDQ